MSDADFIAKLERLLGQRRKVRTSVCLALLLLAGACIPRTLHTAPAGLPHGVAGYTECMRAGARSWIDVKYLDGGNEAPIRAHEAKHAEQMGRFPTCHKFYAWFLPNMADAEAEAFCAAAKADEPPIGKAMVKYANWLSMGYPELELTYGDALTRIAKYCT